MNIGERMKKLRTRKGLSQSQLAKELDISDNSIGMYETGQREPGLEVLEKIANCFDVSMDYLVLGYSSDPIVLIGETSSYLATDKLRIDITNIGELKELLSDIEEKEKALHEAVQKLNRYYLEFSFKKIG